MRVNTVAVCVCLICFYSLTLNAQQSVTPPDRQDSTIQIDGNFLKHTGVEVTNVSEINTRHIEFSPAFYLKGIVYVVSRPEYGRKDPKIGENYFELFYSERDEKEKNFKQPIGYSLQLSSALHEGPMTFSQTWDKVYFTRNNSTVNGGIKRDAEGKTVLKIYEATRGYSDWENINEVPFNGDSYNTCHPSLSADGSRLYFSSNMPGGIGGMDLWYVERLEGSWSEPINLGDQINTIGHEVFPFIHPTNTLIYASNGMEGLGGLDMYITRLDDEEWSKVYNLGASFNSEADDLGLITDQSGTTGYYSSGRSDGAGKDDIYSFIAPNGILNFETPSYKSIFTVIDSKTNVTLEGSIIRIFEETPNGLVAGNEFYDVDLIPTDDNSNEFTLKVVPREGSDPEEGQLVTNEIGQAEYKLKKGKKYVIFVSKDRYNTRKLTYQLATVEGALIPVLLDANDCVALHGLISDKESNTGISNAVVQITNKETGEVQNIYTSPYGEYEFCLPCGFNYSVSINHGDYAPVNREISAADCDELEKFNAELLVEPKAEPVVLPGNMYGPEVLEEGSVIIIKDIFYDFDEYNIRPDAGKSLNELARIMNEHPSMIIDLYSHTDSRGDTRYNKRLSRKRARAARDFLVNKGVQSSRIKPYGMGEEKPRNKCFKGVDCTEEEHQFNRRTEVKITSIDEKIRIQYAENQPEIIDRKG